MRRRWPVLAATIPVALGWALASAHPAVSALTSAGNFSMSYTGPAYPWWFGF